MHHFESASKQAVITLVSEDILALNRMVLMNFSTTSHA
jgi:hypothetical protein